MSCNYADGLSPYEDKGVLGVAEIFDNERTLEKKCNLMAKMIKEARYVVVHTGAGISTSAGIPDFRGPNGVWTLEKQGKKPEINLSFNDAIPTKTHMALKHLLDKNYIRYIVSQNIDGLHLKTGLKRPQIAELHGNMFIARCNTCECQFVLNNATTTVGRKCLNEDCWRVFSGFQKICRGKLHDTILDWEDDLPEKDLSMADYHSSLADLNICLGTTLQIIPSGTLPLSCKKYKGQVIIVNLQPTKYDKQANLRINYFVDEVMERVMKKLGLEIPEYLKETDPTKFREENAGKKVIAWNIGRQEVKEKKREFEMFRKEMLRKRKLENPAKYKKKTKVVKKETLDIEEDESNTKEEPKDVQEEISTEVNEEIDLKVKKANNKVQKKIKRNNKKEVNAKVKTEIIIEIKDDDEEI